MMTKPITDKPRWPFGFRILLWLVGSILAILVVASIFGRAV